LLADLVDTAPVASAVYTSAGDHHLNILAASETSPDAIVAEIAMRATVGLKDIAEKAMKDSYYGLITLLKGRYQKHQNVGKK